MNRPGPSYTELLQVGFLLLIYKTCEAKDEVDVEGT